MSIINPQQNFSPVKNLEPVYMTIPEFSEKVANGEITDNDGVGYYANEEKVSSVKVVLKELNDERYTSSEARLKITREGGTPPQANRMADGTHVAWYTHEKQE